MTEAPAPVLIGDRLEHWARATPDEPAITFADQTWTWAGWHDRIRRLTGALRDKGIGRGDRIAFLDKNHIGCVEAVFAAAGLGAATAIVNWRLADEELVYVLNHAGPRLLFVGAELAPAIERIADRLTSVGERVVVGGAQDAYEPLLASAAPWDRDPEIGPDEVCTVLYSSGTTGKPKGVQLTHRGLVAHTISGNGDFKFERGDMNLVAMPLFHVGGSSYIQIGIHNGAPTYLTREADAATLFAAISAGATHAFLVPAIVAGAFAAGEQAVAVLGKLKYLGYGASPMPYPLLRKALAAWPEMKFIHVYGMTEMGGVVTSLKPEAHRDSAHPERLASAGTPIEGVRLRVVDPATGKDLPPREPGELWLASEQIMAGYLNDEQATAETITEDGWLRSGDIGWVDEDGFVTISDRLKDMIITGGENVYSPEVENAIAAHESVAEVAVIGVADERWGESVKAVVALKPGTDLGAEELIEWTRSRIAHYKSPRHVEFVEALPRNSTGKVLKRQLRK
ncbi:long-chain-fatty-acid--CoA ligase [Sciscionella sediminilitoris]|uniref:long-chain-fatty-acid--CoA ligase n=1 Tax=Sciscionella sediminilitoris TaxID=1445613 RepID=UPI0004DF5D4C|nr:long-chain-fatty-acid--CoA ligase [Sciscionella sp. SE31]